MLTTTVIEALGKAPEAIQYMPRGEHRICALVEGKAQWRTVIVDKDACRRLQADFARRTEAANAGREAQLCILFDHRKGAAAGRPLGFAWDDKKGVLMRVAWSGEGERHLLEKNYGYFSPNFACDPETMRVTGLQRGTNEVGSLVNDPAFQSIERICASRCRIVDLPPRGEVESGGGFLHNDSVATGGGNNTMDTETKAMLGLAPDADDAAVKAAVEKLLAEKKAGEKKQEETQAECKRKEEQIRAMRADEAKRRVDVLIERGVFAPRDEERIQAACAMAECDPENFEKAFGSLGGTSSANEENIAAGRTAFPGADESARDIIARELKNL